MATLIQLRLVSHHTPQEGLSIYQANTTNAYNIMRTGRLVELVEWKFGSAAASLMEHVAAMGFTTASELEARVLDDAELCEYMDKIRFRALLQQLVAAKYIMAVREAHFQSPFDSRQDAERHMRDNKMLSTGTGKKIRLDTGVKVDLELEKRVDGNISGSQVLRELETSPSQVPLFVFCDVLY